MCFVDVKLFPEDDQDRSKHVCVVLTVCYCTYIVTLRLVITLLFSGSDFQSSDTVWLCFGVTCCLSLQCLHRG